MKVPSAIAPDGQLTPAQRRRLLITVFLRRQQSGTGREPQPIPERSAVYQWPDLRAILTGIRWTVVGGVATRAYMPERLTRDFDILVHHQDGDAALARLRRAGYRVAPEQSHPGHLLDAPDGTRIDLLLKSFPWTEDALPSSRRDPAGYPVLDLPYLVLMKMETSRAQDIADLLRMLGLAANEELKQVREVVDRYMPEAYEDLEYLIELGGHEMSGP